jgi:putative addiction module killer protein
MPKEQDVRVYSRSDGSEPFADWLRSLRDGTARNRLRQRIGRVRLGNFGDTRSLGDGLFELRVHLGPGYRVYFGREGDRIVILLSGGDKGSQNRDIERAKGYWQDQRSRSHD